MLEQHESQQTPGLGLIGHQGDEEAREPDGLVTQLVTNEMGPRGCRVAFGEDEIDDRKTDARRPVSW